MEEALSIARPLCVNVVEKLEAVIKERLLPEAVGDSCEADKCGGGEVERVQWLCLHWRRAEFGKLRSRNR